MKSIDLDSLDLGQHCRDHDNRNTGEANQMKILHLIAFSYHVDGVDLMQFVSVFSAERVAFVRYFVIHDL